MQQNSSPKKQTTTQHGHVTRSALFFWPAVWLFWGTGRTEAVVALIVRRLE